MADRLLTAREVADMLGFTRETVLRWTRDGKLPAYKLNGAIRFREVEVETWLKERATTERGVVTQPAGRRPAGNLTAVTQPNSEED